MKSFTLNAIAFAVVLLAGVACSKKIAVQSPQPITPGVSPTIPASPVETRKMLGMVSFTVPLSGEFNQKDYTFGKHYTYVVEDGGKQFVEFAASPILFTNNQHQLAPTSKVVVKMEVKIDHKLSSALKDNEPQIEEVGYLVFEGMVRGTYRTGTSTFVIESLCAEKLNYCRIEKSGFHSYVHTKNFPLRSFESSLC